MKNYVIMLLAVWGTFLLQGCDKDDDVDVAAPPSAVQAAFDAKYPNCYAEWEMEKATNKYKADFHYYGTHAEWNVALSTEANAWYMPDGTWEKTNFEVTYLYRNPSDQFISSAVRTTVAQLAGGREIDLDAVDTPAQDYFLLEVDAEPHDLYYNIDFEGKQF